MYKTPRQGHFSQEDFELYKQAVKDLQSQPEIVECFEEKVCEANEEIRDLEKRHQNVKNLVRESPDTASVRDAFTICTDYYIAQHKDLEREKKKWMSLMPRPPAKEGEIDMEKAKAVPLEEILAERGHEPRRRMGNKLSYLCPFHSEKTPSFVVFTDDNHYHCFGCNATGDSINFVRQVEDCGFKQACKILLRIL